MTTIREAFGPDIARAVDAIRAQYLGVRIRGGGDVPREIQHTECDEGVRRKLMRARLKLYRDDYRAEVESIIRQLYTHDDVITERMRFIDLVGFCNVPKRITDEVASLYDVPAKRRFADPAIAKRFAAAEREVQLHSVMKEAARLTFWMNEVLLWQVKVNEKRSLRVVTPDAFTAIASPTDRLDHVATLIDTQPSWVPSYVVDGRRMTHYELWDSEVVIKLDADGLINKIEAHGLGRMPGVLLHSRLPTESLMNATLGNDIYAAARTILFLNLLIVFVSQASGEKLPLLKGNLAAMTADQPKSAGKAIALPPGVDAEMLDAITSPDHFITVCRHAIASVAQSYGMSYEQFTFSETADTASGKAYSVRREKLNELREEQRQRALVHEAEVADLLGFPGDKLRPDFHEQAIPTDPLEEMELFEKRMNRGLDDPIQYVTRKNTDLSDDEAEDQLKKNMSRVMWYIALLRAANLSPDATAENPGKTPEQNGADGGAKSQATKPEAEKKRDLSWVKEEVRRAA